jgi:hypothetical protein
VTPPAIGSGTVVFCGHCGAEIEEIFWADGIAPSFVSPPMLRDHARDAGHRVAQVHCRPLEVQYHTF